MKHAPARFLGSDRQASTLVIVKTPPLVSELLARDAVLFLKIFDHVLLALVQPAREGNEQSRKGFNASCIPPSYSDRPRQGRARLAPSCTCKLFSFYTDRVFDSAGRHPKNIGERREMSWRSGPLPVDYGLSIRLPVSEFVVGAAWKT